MGFYENYVTLLNINDGAQGENAQQYRIDSNQNEILKYFIQQEDWRFVPNELVVTIYKLNPETTRGEEQIPINSLKDQLAFFVYNEDRWQNFNIPENKENLIFSSISEGRLTLYLNNLKIFAKAEKIADESEEEYENRINSVEYKTVKYLTEKETILRIRWELRDELNKFYFSEKNIGIRHAMTEDMAKLAIKADGIYASIASTALNFNSDGLTIKNGGIKIIKHNYKQIEVTEEDFPYDNYYILLNNEYILSDNYSPDFVYYIKQEEDILYGDNYGNLTIKGTIYATDGQFSGIVKAIDGEFNGIINANGGLIGGFNINKNSLYSIKKIEDSEQSSIILDGNEGKIYAQSIELGTGAHISDFLLLGDKVKLWNPDRNISKNFLEVSNFLTFNQEGFIILGEQNGPQIKIDGPNQEIRGWNPNTNNVNFTWAISPEQAIFNNIVARGSIKAVTFEYGSIQAIGGTMLIRPSSRITAVEGQKVVLDNNQSGFEQGDICLLENNKGEALYYKIEQIQDGSLILNNSPSINSIGSPIINLGQQGSVGIGINGSVNEVYGMSPNAISILEFDGYNLLIPKIILGKLPENQESFGQAAGHYGLYAENVVLNGSLTTKTATNLSVQLQEENENLFNYSGIGTTIYNGAPNVSNIKDVEQKFPYAKNIGQILLWAGAPNSTKEGIESSKFFVDEFGNMYAGSGYFDGTIITNSIIEAAEIRTAKITGIGKDKNGQDSLTPALLIQDVKEGIHFYKGNNNGEQDLVFQLNSTEFKVDGLQAIFNNNFIINTNGELELFKIQLKEFNEENKAVNAMLIAGRKIEYSESFIELFEDANIVISPDNKNKFIIDQSGFSMNGSLFYMYNNEIKSEYKQVVENDQVIGYDLYIY